MCPKAKWNRCLVSVSVVSKSFTSITIKDFQIINKFRSTIELLEIASNIIDLAKTCRENSYYVGSLLEILPRVESWTNKQKK